MQKVTSKLPSWDQTKQGSKKGFDKVWGWADKLGAPVNRLTNKIGSEAFWPTTLDKECDKAARILRSFCKDGFYAQEDRPLNQDGPAANTKQRVLKKIPQKVIQNAVGLAIFTTMRTGLWVSGAGGSGVLIARMENGEWSPPSGILLHTAGLGFMVGVDIYDCVLVINNRKALEAFKSVRATLGGEVSVVAGPVGVGGVLENDGKWKEANRPVFTYLKSRGFYAGVQVDGTLVIERSDENERFYGEKISVTDILAGKARHPPPEIRMLMETVKAAEGRSNVDEALMDELDGQPAPGDVEVEAPGGHLFGIPEPDDPDPFGVLALEQAGLEIREAGTKSRPPSSQFEYKPSPRSPAYAHFHRRSTDTFANGGSSSNRGSSYASYRRTSSDRFVQMVETGTQTSEEDLATLPKRSTWSSSSSSSLARRSPAILGTFPRRLPPPPLPPRNPTWTTNGQSAAAAPAQSPLAIPDRDGFVEVDLDGRSQGSVYSVPDADRDQSPPGALGIVVGQDADEKKEEDAGEKREEDAGVKKEEDADPSSDDAVDVKHVTADDVANPWAADEEAAAAAATSVPDKEETETEVRKSTDAPNGLEDGAAHEAAREEEPAPHQAPVVVEPAAEDQDSDDFRSLPATPNAEAAKQI